VKYAITELLEMTKKPQILTRANSKGGGVNYQVSGTSNLSDTPTTVQALAGTKVAAEGKCVLPTKTRGDLF